MGPSREITAETCFSCKIKKRKCDRQVPACSRCKRANIQCLYGSSAAGVYGRIIPVTSTASSQISPAPSASAGLLHPQILSAVGSGSCRRCNRQHKSCDKSYPTCSRCKRMNACCTYETLDRLHLLTSQHVFTSRPVLPRTVAYQPQYPVEAKPYIPELIRCFQDRMGLSTLDVSSTSLAHHLRSSWLRYALADPCLFHATLYASSAQLDISRHTNNGIGAGLAVPHQMTLYHHTQTIIALNTRLAIASAIDDATIAAVLLLVISGSLEKDHTAAEVHQKGLLRMVAMRGGFDKLGFDGFLAQMIQMNMVLPAIIFDRLDANPVSGDPGTGLATSSLLTMALDELRISPLDTGDSAIRSIMLMALGYASDLLRMVDLEDNEGGATDLSYSCSSSIARPVTPIGEELEPFLSQSESVLAETVMFTSERSMVQSCLYSVRILRRLLHSRYCRIPASEEPQPQQQQSQHQAPLSSLISILKHHISQTTPTTWLRYSPHANLWVTTLGMAVSESIEERLWFLVNERCVVMSISASKPAPHELVWGCYRGFRRLVQRRLAK
ncbi:hypothetical protein BJX64DRAFT_269043 [Aspergillus heterothallicus]